jgi:hypothetical protein
MLDETTARASEIVAINVEDLDLEQRRGTRPLQRRRQLHQRQAARSHRARTARSGARP